MENLNLEKNGTGSHENIDWFLLIKICVIILGVLGIIYMCLMCDESHGDNTPTAIEVKHKKCGCE